MKKRIFLIGIIILIAIFKINNISNGVDQTEKFDEITYVNPNYSNVLTEQKIEKMVEQDEKTKGNFLSYDSTKLKSTYKGQYFYDNKDSAANFVKNKMKDRVRQITVRCETNESNFQNVATSIVKKAISEELAKYSDEGDYLAWSYGGYIVSGGYYKSGNKYYWVLNYTFTYYTTYEQEKILGGRIDSFLKTINIKKESQYSLVKQINDYICKNVEYDYYHVSDSSYKLQFTAYAALIKGEAVCQGYSTLLYRMLKECGIDNRIIVSSTHSWNIVKIGNLYYNVDEVWNDGIGNDRYLLSGSEDFVKNTEHIRNNEYTTSEFNKKYPMSKNKFQVKLNKVNNIISTKNKANEITLKWDVQENITGYKLYKYNYEKKCWEYFKQIKGAKNNKYNIKGLKEGSLYKFRIRAYVTINNKKIHGQYSNNFKTITAPKDALIKSLNNEKEKQIKIKWKKINSSSGYQIQIATNRKFTQNSVSYLIKDNNINIKVVKKLKKGKKYYFRVRSYKNYLGNKYYSNWSEIKAIKCK